MDRGVAHTVTKAIGSIVRTFATAHVKLSRNRSNKLDGFEAGATMHSITPGLIFT